MISSHWPVEGVVSVTVQVAAAAAAAGQTQLLGNAAYLIQQGVEAEHGIITGTRASPQTVAAVSSVLPHSLPLILTCLCFAFGAYFNSLALLFDRVLCFLVYLFFFSLVPLLPSDLLFCKKWFFSFNQFLSLILTQQ